MPTTKSLLARNFLGALERTMKFNDKNFFKFTVDLFLRSTGNTEQIPEPKTHTYINKDNQNLDYKQTI